MSANPPKNVEIQHGGHKILHGLTYWLSRNDTPQWTRRKCPNFFDQTKKKEKLEENIKKHVIFHVYDNKLFFATNMVAFDIATTISTLLCLHMLRSNFSQ